jgi:hypothetical protein
MPDPVTIASGISAVKTTFDALRAAIGFVRDTRELLPKEKAEVVNAALANDTSRSEAIRRLVEIGLTVKLDPREPTDGMTRAHLSSPVKSLMA